MSAKSRVLEFLVEKKGAYISGGEMAKELNVSRNTIWKAVKALQEEGYAISAVSNRGYCLKESNLRLSKEEIMAHLSITSCRLEVYESVTSTNTMAKKRAQAGEQEGLVIIAEEQTKGKGRSGRSFYSPKECGIYMSILLRPTLDFTRATYLTTCAATAVAEALDDFVEGETQIKWVNDIIYQGRKAAGILTEAAVDMEDGKLEYAILGIGVNIFPPGEAYPEEIREIATPVFAKREGLEGIRGRLIARILECFFSYYQELAKKEYYDVYKRKSFVLGQMVQVLKGKEVWEGKAVDVDKDFHLIVEGANGKRESLSSGEIRIRPLDGSKKVC